MISIRDVSLAILFSLVLSGMAQPARAQSTIAIGENAVLSAPDSDNANLLIAQEATLSQTATIYLKHISH